MIGVSYFIASVPDVVWAAVLASLLTLSGVIASNRSNSYRLKLQLEHESTEKAKDRKATLRREVYLYASEEMVKVTAYLASLPQMDLTKINAGEGLTNFGAAVAKLQLIAEPETVRLITELYGKLGQLFFRLLIQAEPIHSLKSDIDIADGFYKRHDSEVQRILSAMTQYNESASTNIEVFQGLDRSFKFHSEQRQKYAEDRNIAWEKVHPLQREFLKTYATELKATSELQVHTMVAMRGELDVGGDIAMFTTLMNKQWESVNAQLDSLLKELERMATETE